MRYRHEIFVGAKCGQKLGQVRKWLHSDALADPYDPASQDHNAQT